MSHLIENENQRQHSAYSLIHSEVNTKKSKERVTLYQDPNVACGSCHQFETLTKCQKMMAKLCSFLLGSVK